MENYEQVDDSGKSIRKRNIDLILDKLKNLPLITHFKKEFESKMTIKKLEEHLKIMSQGLKSRVSLNPLVPSNSDEEIRKEEEIIKEENNEIEVEKKIEEKKK